MSRVSKIFQCTKTKPQGRLGGLLYLSWPCNPLIASPTNSTIPSKVPNFDRVLYNESLSLLESTYYLIAPKQREDLLWRPWITKVDKVDTTTWRVLQPTLDVDSLIKPFPTVLGELGKPSSYLIKELAKSYTLKDDDDRNLLSDMKAHKVLPLFDQGDHVQLLALKWEGTLALLKQGHESWSNIIPDHGDGVFVDIAAHQGRFYATDSNEGLYIIDGNKAMLITKASDHAIFDNNVEEYDELYGGRLSMVEYDGQLCLFKFIDCSRGKILAHRTGGNDELQTWDVVKSVRNKILFKINEVSFTLPAHLLDRKFQGDWICYCDDACEQRHASLGGLHIDGSPYMAEFEQGILPLERLFFDILGHCFEKCDLVKDTNIDDNDTVKELNEWQDEGENFRWLPNDEYISLFFPPPPWIQYYCLDPNQGYPPIRFDKCYLPKHQFDSVDDKINFVLAMEDLVQFARWAEEKEKPNQSQY